MKKENLENEKIFEIYFFSYDEDDAKKLRNYLNSLGFDMEYSLPEKDRLMEGEKFFDVFGNTSHFRVQNSKNFEKEMKNVAKIYNSDFDRIDLKGEIDMKKFQKKLKDEFFLENSKKTI
jgi:phage terminase large subunit-like protein